MYVTPDKFAASSKAGVEAALGFAQAQFAAFERLAQLNIESTKEVMADTADHVKTLLDAKDPQELIKLNTAYSQPALAKAVNYGKSVYDVATQTQASVTGLVEGHAAELNRNVVALLDTIAKNSPVGGDAALGAVKSALAAVNTAYDSLTRVAKQAAEVVDVNFANAASAAVAPKKAGRRAA
jgi:phasin family protein